MSRSSILREVSDERDRQDQKWGPQSADHVPNGTGDDVICAVSALPYGVAAELAKAACGRGTSHAAILLEETYEALAESDPFALRRELGQIAAVCVKWMEKLDRVDLAVPDAGGVVPESADAVSFWGPLIAAPKAERCNSRGQGERCLLAKGHTGLHRAQCSAWVPGESFR